jgi:hypothetical protein
LGETDDGYSLERMPQETSQTKYCSNPCNDVKDRRWLAVQVLQRLLVLEPHDKMVREKLNDLMSWMQVRKTGTPRVSLFIHQRYGSLEAPRS